MVVSSWTRLVRRLKLALVDPRAPEFHRLIQEDRFAICQFEAIYVPFRSPVEGAFLVG